MSFDRIRLLRGYVVFSNWYVGRLFFAFSLSSFFLSICLVMCIVFLYASVWWFVAYLLVYFAIWIAWLYKPWGILDRYLDDLKGLFEAFLVICMVMALAFWFFFFFVLVDW